jgi:hypothetical protein
MKGMSAFLQSGHSSSTSPMSALRQKQPFTRRGDLRLPRKCWHLTFACAHLRLQPWASPTQCGS